MVKSIIVAASQNGIIGANNQLPWRLPADMERFKELTMGHTLIMGRKTYESLPPKMRPLPGRMTIALTRAEAAIVPIDHRLKVAFDLEQALNEAAAAEDAARKSDLDGYLDPEIFVCGGAQVYSEALPLCDYVYLTVVERDYEGDVSFPYPELLVPGTEFAECAGATWERTASKPGEGELPHRFETWKRLK